MNTRTRLIPIINDWSDEPDSFEDWDSVLKVNVLIAAEKEFGIKFNMADVPSITGLNTLCAFLEPRTASKKVLVLDCDGVLWDGIAGEGTAHVSERATELQLIAADLESKGVLLCLCSKNNEQDVHDTGDELFGMILQSRHFVAEEISWDSKVDGLKRLAARLNLGLDSFVFVDDSPIERAEIKERLPEVIVLDTVEPLTTYFTHLPSKSLTAQYRLRQTVETAMSEASDRQAFLDSLDMRAVMRVNDTSLAPRIAELSQKTNQFNMTLRRFTEEDIRQIMHDVSGVGYLTFCASLTDRFGDAGWVAMAVFELVPKGWVLEDFCVSCRVLGRGFERAFIEKCIQNLYAKEIYPLHFTHVPGPKNAVCANFFEGQKIVTGRIVAEHVPHAPVKWEE